MLLLESNNLDHFLNFAKRRPSHKVIMAWSYCEDMVKYGKRPVEAPDEYGLSFKLLEWLYKWIFDTKKERKERVLRAKQGYLSNITIYRYEDEMIICSGYNLILEDTREL